MYKRQGLQGLVNSVVDGNGVGQNGLLFGLGGEESEHIVVDVYKRQVYF